MDQSSALRGRHADFAGYGTPPAPACCGFYLFRRHSFQTTFFPRSVPKRSLRHASTTPVRLKARPHRQRPTIRLERNRGCDVSGEKSKVCSLRNRSTSPAGGSARARPWKNSQPSTTERKPENIQERMNGAKIRPKV